jgi:hypothetical protein
VNASERKVWNVPRFDTRTLTQHRHPRETSFPGLTILPAIVLHIKDLWNLCYKASDAQQPSKPSSCVKVGVANSRYLGHSSVTSGWEHMRQALYQISKVLTTVEFHVSDT